MKPEPKPAPHPSGPEKKDDTRAKPLNAQSLEDRMRESIKSGNHEDVNRYRELYMALLDKNWKEVAHLIENDTRALKTVISESSETFFHIIVVFDQAGAILLLRTGLQTVERESLQSLQSVLEQKDIFGFTALFRAASVGNIEAARRLVGNYRKLLQMRNEQQLLPVHCAGLNGHKETFEYLLSETEKEDSNLVAGPSGLELVKILIEANLYDIASKLLERVPNLAPEDLPWRGTILETLAKKPFAFASGSRRKNWQQLIYNCIPVQEEPQLNIFGAWRQKLYIVLWNIIMHLAPSIQGIHDKKLMHKHTVKIVRMCAGTSWGLEEALTSLKMPILTAATSGISEIVKEIYKAFPNSLIFVDERGNNALMLAILHRQEEVFRLVSESSVMKQFKGDNLTNEDGENILHLATKSVPASEIPAAALQLQRELQLFKAVENYVQPPLREQCIRGRTPREVFTEEHKELIEKGEKWMKDNASSSCTIVVSLIIAVMFPAVVTVPGGHDDKGIPNFLHQLSFRIFLTSAGLALWLSITSLLIFSSILKFSSSEEDFLVSLPRKLIIGSITRFFSIACMMVAFGATIYMVVSHLWKLAIIPIVLLSCIPMALLAKQEFTLLVLLYSSTYAPTISQPADDE